MKKVIMKIYFKRLKTHKKVIETKMKEHDSEKKEQVDLKKKEMVWLEMKIIIADVKLKT